VSRRDDPDLDALAWQSLAVRAGVHRGPEGEHAEPIYTTSSYVFGSAAEAAARFSGDQPGNVYSRYTNPTVRAFEERLAALEGAQQCVATASGMGAILSVCMALLKAGDHVICSRDVFGTTRSLFARYLEKFGVEVSFVPLLPVDGWREALRGNTRLLYLETPSNPLCEVADLAAMRQLAADSGALLVVDNCFCTPALQQPLAHGADIVIHSATKYLDGQGRCVGGAALGRAELMDQVVAFLRSCGPTLSPFNAWVFLKSLETLGLRMQAHSDNAQQLAEWLTQQPAVEQVFYAGLPEHPGHARAAPAVCLRRRAVLPRARRSRRAWRLIDATRLMSLTANLGDAKTTIVHPATTTHGRLSAEERAAAGITENLIRVAVGLEAVADLRADLARGLAAV
jgi:O-succinylhomoserine sulfhydrylase